MCVCFRRVQTTTLQAVLRFRQHVSMMGLDPNRPPDSLDLFP